jgi:hypothetical protein
MDAYVQWLENNLNLPGAQVLLNRHYNTDGQNLTGHFKQCFYATIGFLTEMPQIKISLVSELGRLQIEDVYQPSEQVAIAWFEYIEKHATDFGDEYDHSVLLRILPPPLGGTVSGGGGGSSTFKRMLPLVALYLCEAGR